MKRLCLLLCAVLVLLNACRSQYTATDLMAKILTVSEGRSVTIYFSKAETEGEGYLSAENIMLLYNGMNPTVLSEDYAIALSKDDELFEVHLYRALNTDNAEEIESVLQARMLLLQSEEKGWYVGENPAERAILMRSGNWVALLVTEDNAAVKELLSSML